MGKYQIMKGFIQIGGVVIIAEDEHSALKRAQKLSFEECYPLKTAQTIDIASEILPLKNEKTK